MHPNLAKAIDSIQEISISTADESASSSYSSVMPHQYRPQQYELEPPSASRPAASAAINIGQICDCNEDLLPQLHAAGEQHFDFIVAPLVWTRRALHAARHRSHYPCRIDPCSLCSSRRVTCLPQGAHRPTPSSPHALSFTAPDSLMCASSWSHRVVGAVSDWIQLDDCSPNIAGETVQPSFRRRLESEEAFKRELAWAAHLSLPAVLVQCPPAPTAVANLARCINHTLLQTQAMQMWLTVPLVATAPPFNVASNASDSASVVDRLDSWHSWNQVRNLCESHRRLGVVIELGADLPPLVDETHVDLTLPTAARPAEDYIVSRWLGEPVRAVLLSTEVFLINKKGYPVLSQAHQRVVKRLFEMQNVQWILRDDHGRSHAMDVAGASSQKAETPLSKLGLQSFQNYLRHLFATHVNATHSEQYSFELPYRDYLQAPLQPLQDNLESGVYEVFEKDPVKYRLYEDAVRLALTDMFVQGGDDSQSPRVAQVMVVGAGRGPLVRCVLRAAASAGVPVAVYAIEKNPNAIETLRSLQSFDPDFADVTVIASDMREWRGPADAPNGGDGFADLIVSELLGSFGDNELSPECLDGALRFLRAGGVSIPQNSVSYLAPISSTKLWNEVDAFDSLKTMETSYVVAMHNYFRMAPPLKPAFKFVHRSPADRPEDEAARMEGEWNEQDNPELVQAEQQKMQQLPAGTPTTPASAAAAPNNSRHVTLTFDIPLAGTLHGFAGFFTSQLYRDIELSIVPGKRFSHGMFSWFPIFFPIRVRKRHACAHREGST